MAEGSPLCPDIDLGRDVTQCTSEFYATVAYIIIIVYIVEYM